MATNASIGHGTLFKVGNGATPTEVFAALAEITEVGGFNMTMDAVDATHMASSEGFREYIMGLGESGEIAVTCNFIETGDDVEDAFTDMKARSAKNYQIVFPGGAIWQCAGYVQGIEISPPIDDKMSATFTFKMSGLPTFTKAS